VTRFQSWYHALPKAFRWLLTINVVLYVCWVILLAHIPVTRDFVFNHLALNPALPDVLFEPWQLITYNFLHLGSLQNPGLSFGSLLHIGFNMLWLYWVGREQEELHGPHQLVALYLITGVGGGLFSMLLHGLIPAFTGGASVVLIHGASASVLGVITAVAVTYPQKKIGLLFIGPVRLLYLVLAFLAFDLLVQFGGDTAVAAHLGGALFGFLFVKIEAKRVDLTSWTRVFFREPRRRPRRSAPEHDETWSLLRRLEARLAARNKEKEPTSSGGDGKRRTSKSPLAKIRVLHSTEPSTVALESEVNRILDKISEEGIESLTDEEKRFLEEASRQ